MNTGFIYTIENENGIYIGCTINVSQRQTTHRSKENKEKGLRHGESKIKLTVIDVFPESELFYWENFYVELFRQWGFKIINKIKIRPNALPYSERTNEKMLQRRNQSIQSQTKTKHNERPIL
jgi:predicted GIY-YIG superfamily endonuclease